MSRRLHNLQRRLDRWELKHLRQHAAELAERLEAAEKRADDALRRLSDAEYTADFWHGQAMDVHREAAERTGGVQGLAMDGSLVIVPATGAEGLHA